MLATAESTRRFSCFGALGVLYAGGADPAAERALTAAQFRLLACHRRLSRFRPDSELCRLNADPRERVPASSLMRRFVRGAIAAAELSGGLVDATLVDEIERAGYADSYEPARALPLEEASAADRRPARPRRKTRWRTVEVDDAAGLVVRPPGVRFDSGGIAKGLAADLVAPLFENQSTFAIDCAGDLRIGGVAGSPRSVAVDDPFGRGTLHGFRIVEGGVATSGIGRRSWRGADGAYAHHLLDPSTGAPAHTGVVQATALAPTALEAEVRAKAALLAGPEAGAKWLRHGGALVLDDGSFELVEGAMAE
jgi:thiamine biosynthesis lipoprotein